MSVGASITLDDLNADPDPILARLRAEEPVSFVPSLDMWLVTRWDDIAHIEEHPEVFSASTEPSYLARVLGRSMLNMDPPEHTRLRTIMGPPLDSRGRSGDFVRDELGDLADALIDRLPSGPFDLMAHYAQPLAAGSLATVLGLDDLGAARVWDFCEELCAAIANFTDDAEVAARGDAVAAELGHVIASRIEAARTDSAIAAFARAGATSEEIVNNVRLMVSGGINEPRDSIGLTVLVLLTRNDIRRHVDEEPRLLRRLIEEVFRVYSPVGTAARQTTTDVELGGVSIPAGSIVAAVLRSANLDERRWSNPTEIDLHRREGTHAAFALGAHRCIGEWLGRQQVRIGVTRLLNRVPGLRLDPDHDVSVTGFEFHGPHELWVTR